MSDIIHRYRNKHIIGKVQEKKKKENHFLGVLWSSVIRLGEECRPFKKLHPETGESLAIVLN